MKNYICEDCKKIFLHKSSFINHKNRKTKCTENIYKKKDEYICKKCNRNFKKKSHYENHLNKKINCFQYNYDNMEDKVEEKLEEIFGGKSKKLEEKLEEQNKKLEEQNKLILLLTEKMNNISTTNNTTNNNTTNNNTTINKNNNYNYIINNYKDALNLEDCINSDRITKEMIEECSNMYYEDGSIFLIKKLCDIDIKKRPLHCTDINRKNYIVKTQDEWKTDIGGHKLKKTILPVVDKVYDDIFRIRYEKDNNISNYAQNIGNILEKNKNSRFKKMMNGTAASFLLKKE